MTYASTATSMPSVKGETALAENKHYETAKVVDLKAFKRKLEVIRYTPEQLKLDLGVVSPPLQDLFFSPVFLFQTCLPMREPKLSELINGAYVRRNGDLVMEIRSTEGPHCLPWGKFPRQFLMWLTNAVKRYPDSLNAEGHFCLQGSYREFCRSVGVNSSSGANGSGRKLLGQVNRLMTTTFTFKKGDELSAKRGQRSTKHFAVSTELNLAWDEQSSRPKEWMDNLGGSFKLSRDFCEEIREHAFPVDARHLALVCAGKSPLRIDVYHWAHYRVGYYHRNDRPATEVPWTALHGQFGTHGSIYEFVRQFTDELRWIQENVWRDLHWTVKDNGSLLLHKVEPTVEIRRRFR